MSGRPAVVATGDAWLTGIRTPAFRRITAAWLVSTVGDGVRMAALPLYTAVTTRDPIAVSVVAAAEVVPWLFMSALAGALVDRSRPRRVVVLAHGLRCLLLAALTYAVVTDQAGVVVLAAAALVLTTIETFADSAAQVLLVELAGEPDLSRANSRFVSVQTAGENLVGPLFAGVLFAWSPAACFGLDALSFAVAAVVIARLPDVRPDRSAGGAGESLRAQILEGFRFLAFHAALRAQLIAVAAGAAAAGVMNALLALYALEVLGMRPSFMPSLLVVLAVSGLLSARAAPALAEALGEGRVMVTALLVCAGGFALLGLATVPAVAFLACAAVGAGSGCWNVLSATRRQRLTPRHLLGRLGGVYQMLAWGLMPLGAALAGPLAKATSLGAVLVGSGLLVIVVLLLVARPLLRADPARDATDDHSGEGVTACVARE
jgi:Na+/melibiose symporter-like transporter